MKTVAVIMREDRENDVVTLKRKHLNGNSFIHGGHVYFIEPDRFQITPRRHFFGLFRSDQKNFYYIRKLARPLPVPLFETETANEEAVRVDKNGKPVKGSKNGHVTVPKIVNLGVAAEELAALFNPFFFRIISQMEKPWYKELHFWISCAALGAMAYGIYLITGMMDDLETLKASLQATRAAIGGETP